MAVTLDVEQQSTATLDTGAASVVLDVGGGTSATFGADEYIPIHTSELPTYEGPYTTTPAWDAKTFQTARHQMLDDFSVAAIIELEAPNDFGGLTLTI